MNAKDSLKPLVRGAYDLQGIRIMMGNRIVMNWKAKAGRSPTETDAEGLPAEDVKYLKMLKTHYRKIASGLAAAPKTPVSRKRAAKGETPIQEERAEREQTPEAGERLPSRKAFVGDEIISTYTELVLLAQYIDLEAEEAKHFRRLSLVLEEFPIYTRFLQPTYGCGPAMSGIIISEIDIAKARYPSSLWAYAGLDVHTFTNGTGEIVSEGRSRRAHHLVDRSYINASGEEAVRKSITFNPLLKTKLLGVLGPSFLKCGNEEYRKLYDDYKHRLECDPRRAEWTKGRRHNAAIRYMIKMFLRDLSNSWRALEGLPVAPTYAEAKLGLVHHAGMGKTPSATKRVAKGKKPGDRKRAIESNTPDVIKRKPPIAAKRRRTIPDAPRSKAPPQSRRRPAEPSVPKFHRHPREVSGAGIPEASSRIERAATAQPPKRM